jgi:Lactonase, 7-bladed beta-propeller
MNLQRSLFALGLGFLAALTHAVAEEPELTEVQRIDLPDVVSAICAAISADGRFSYAATGAAAREVSIFKRDMRTDRIKFIGAVKQPQIICPMRLRFVAAEKYLVATDARTDSAPIFQRDDATGLLTKLTDISADVVNEAGLGNFNDAQLNPDCRFVYTFVPMNWPSIDGPARMATTIRTNERSP